MVSRDFFIFEFGASFLKTLQNEWRIDFLL